MSRYIFLDNWVFSLIRDREVEARLIDFVNSNDFTVLLTSLSMVELYNPGWQEAERTERGAVAVRFLASVPCVMVDPLRVWSLEVAAHLKPLRTLPLELDLTQLSPKIREAALLGLSRRDDAFLRQGKDIQAWSLQYKEAKETWLSDVERIVEKACIQGFLKRAKAGGFMELDDTKELFLFSLDFRLAEEPDIDATLADFLERTRAGRPPLLTSVRLSSLCFWYSYVDIDRTNQPKRQGSDLGDLYHISLLPYCSAFTTDGTMWRMLKRIREKIVPVRCNLMTKQQLEERLQNHD